MDSSKKRTYIVAAAAFVLIVASIYFLFVRQKGDRAIKPGDQEKIVKDISEIDIGKRPFVTLTPTSDGAEIIIAIEKMSDFDKIEYELTYLADNPLSAGEKIERGATGSDINSKDEKYKNWIILADTVGIPPKNESLDPASVILPVVGAFTIAPNPSKPIGLKISVEGK